MSNNSQTNVRNENLFPGILRGELYDFFKNLVVYIEKIKIR